MLLMLLLLPLLSDKTAPAGDMTQLVPASWLLSMRLNQISPRLLGSDASEPDDSLLDIDAILKLTMLLLVLVAV
jgi:hypothetical protein